MNPSNGPLSAEKRLEIQSVLTKVCAVLVLATWLIAGLTLITPVSREADDATASIMHHLVPLACMILAAMLGSVGAGSAVAAMLATRQRGFSRSLLGLLLLNFIAGPVTLAVFLMSLAMGPDVGNPPAKNATQQAAPTETPASR